MILPDPHVVEVTYPLTHPRAGYLLENDLRLACRLYEHESGTNGGVRRLAWRRGTARSAEDLAACLRKVPGVEVVVRKVEGVS